MKNSYLNKKSKCPARIIVIITNAVVLLVGSSSDLLDCLFKMVELIAFIKTVITFYKWYTSKSRSIALGMNTNQANK